MGTWAYVPSTMPRPRASWSPRAQDRIDAALQPFEAAALEAAGVRRRQRVIDLGCDSPETALALSSRVGPNGVVLAIDRRDAGVPQLRRRVQALGLDGVAMLELDDFDAPFPGPVDVVFSRFGLAGLPDPVRAVHQAARALSSGGRLVLLVWQGPPANQWLREADAALGGSSRPGPKGAGPFVLSDPARLQAVLTGAGLEDIAIRPVVHPLALDDDEGRRALVAWLAWQRGRDVDLRRHTVRSCRPASPLAWDRWIATWTPTFTAAAWLVTARKR